MWWVGRKGGKSSGWGVLAACLLRVRVVRFHRRRPLPIYGSSSMATKRQNTNGTTSQIAGAQPQAPTVASLKQRAWPMDKGSKPNIYKDGKMLRLPAPEHTGGHEETKRALSGRSPQYQGIAAGRRTRLRRSYRSCLRQTSWVGVFKLCPGRGKGGG